MKKLFLLTLCSTILCSTWLLTGATWFGSDESEISPMQYAGLLGLREMDPVMFKEKLLPMIDTAMKDNKITQSELDSMQKEAGNVAKAFYETAKAPRLQDSFNEVLGKAEQSSKSLGNKLNETFNEEVPKLFNDALGLFRDQLNQYKQEKPAQERPNDAPNSATKL